MNPYLVKITRMAALVLASASFSFAQAVKVEPTKPTFDDLQSPQFSGGKQKSFKPKDWLEVEAKLRLDMRPLPKSGMVERITVKWYIAIKNPEKSGSLLLLTRDVEHVNVPLGEDVYVSIYLSPASIKRITGSDRGGKNAIEVVGYEVIVNGSKEAAETSKLNAGWWDQPSERISRSDTVPLLNKSETPFHAMWWDRYAEVLTQRASN